MYSAKGFSHSRFIWKKDNYKSLQEVLYMSVIQEISGDILSINLYKNLGIIIEAKSDLYFFNHNFKLKGSNLKIIIYCFESDDGNEKNDNYSIEEILHKNDYCIIATNTCIRPKEFFDLQEKAFRTNCHLILMDQMFLLNYFQAHCIKWGNIEKVNSIQHSYFSIDPQSDNFINDKNQTEMSTCLLIRNFTETSRYVEINIATQQNWKIATDESPCYNIGPYDAYAFRIPVVKKMRGGIDDLIINIHCDNKEFIITIPETEGYSGFQTQFYGAKNIKIAKDLTDLLNIPNEFKVLYLFGAAGIGKSRIIEELNNFHLNAKVKVIRYEIPIVSSNTNSLLETVKNALSEQCLISKESMQTISSLTELVEFFNENLYRGIFQPVIVLDDFHNAEKNLIDEIINLTSKRVKSPIKLLIIGRDDFSAGSVDYYNFTEWCRKNITGFTVKGLGRDETSRFILSILSGPLESYNPIIKKIARYSCNNPLFIVQYIQHLIDCGIAELCEDGKVKIHNEKYNNTVMPSKIEKLYEARFNKLEEKTLGAYQKILTAICVAAMIGKTFNKSILEEQLSENDIELLLKRNFILQNLDKFRFAHETILLYIKKLISRDKKLKERVAVSFIVEHPSFFAMLNVREKGKIFCWNHNYNEALKYFESDVNQIKFIDNYSSINIDRQIYNYIDCIIEIYKSMPESGGFSVIVNALYVKCYISLHYITPYKAIEDCKHAQSILCELPGDISCIAKNSIKALEAHANMNSGNYKKAEIIYLELIAEYLYNSESFESKALFDIWDRYGSLHMSYNEESLAKRYIALSEKIIKEKNNDPNLFALTQLTKGKLCYFHNPSETYQDVVEIKKLARFNEVSERIKCHISLTEIISSFFKDNRIEPNAYIEKTTRILNEALKNSYTAIIVRCYNFLATLYYLLEKEHEHTDFKYALRNCNRGLEACINYGTGYALWNFYNLKAMISIRLQESNQTLRYMNAMYSTIKRQGLLRIDSSCVCFGNILALNNVARYNITLSETKFRKEMGEISFHGEITGCQTNCNESSCRECTISGTRLKEWSKKALNKENIISSNIAHCFLDEEIGYYFIVS